MKSDLKVAIVHDWLVSPGGAERVVLALHELWPNAPIYTTAYSPEKFPEFSNADVRPLWLNNVPFMKTKHQLFPLLRALAWNLKKLNGYDVVITSSTAEAKYVRVGKGTIHISYCHTPVRYYWSDYDWYLKNPPFGKLNWLAKAVLPMLIGPLRKIDFQGAQRVNYYIANSKFVAARIKKYYKRSSDVIYPPIITERFSNTYSAKDYYLIVGRQVAYKRLDIAIDAFNELGLKLKIAGSGEDALTQKLRANDNIEFLGRVSDSELADLFSGAKGFIFPPEEDFGMIPVEAMAAGCPVIAYGKGGALESVVEGITGTFFYEQTGKSLAEAVRRFEGMHFDTKGIRDHAKLFDVEVFKKQIAVYIDNISR